MDYTHIKPSCTKEKASVSAFWKVSLSGSVTVEAVLCIPLFVYAAVCLIWMLELRSVQIRVRCALQEAGKRMSIELAEMPVLLPGKLETEMMKALGEEWLESSCIEGRLDCGKSYSVMDTGIMELRVHYKVKLPVPFFRIPLLDYEEAMRMKMWNGYVKNGFSNLTGMQEMVYVTETGVVYHKEYHCSYLEPSIHEAGAGELENLRNESGEKYYSCESCGKISTGHYYITDYGDRFHSSLSCSGIKRKIYRVPISEVKGKGACSKCGK